MLKWFYNLKNPIGRLAMWASELIEFQYKTEHRKGGNNIVSDSSSRKKNNFTVSHLSRGKNSLIYRPNERII